MGRDAHCDLLCVIFDSIPLEEAFVRRFMNFISGCILLQSVQNVAARLICRLRRFDHATDTLVSLHLLRVLERFV